MYLGTLQAINESRGGEKNLLNSEGKQLNIIPTK